MDPLYENEPNLFIGPNGRFMRYFGWVGVVYVMFWPLVVWIGP